MAYTVTACYPNGTRFPYVTDSRDLAYRVFDEYRAAIDGAHVGAVFVELASDGVTNAMHGTPPAPVAVEPEPEVTAVPDEAQTAPKNEKNVPAKKDAPNPKPAETPRPRARFSTRKA